MITLRILKRSPHGLGSVYANKYLNYYVTEFYFRETGILQIRFQKCSAVQFSLKLTPFKFRGNIYLRNNKT